MASSNSRSLLANLLILISIGLLVAVFLSPIWWVSLTAPNYPEEAFPDGVRIHFHMNGVFNGCKKVEKTEITEDEALDCVHEMDTINHYVGMYPIAAGGVIERAFSPFLMALLGMMLLGFLFRSTKLRMPVLGVGFAVIAVWMYLTWYGAGGLRYQNTGYVSALITALDQDTSKESAARLGSGSDVIERLKQSLQESGVTMEEEKPALAGEQSSKADKIESLRVTFEKDQERRSPGDRMQWDGSGSQMMSWHYEKSLGRYFNNPQEIKPMVSAMTTMADIVFWGIIGAMLLLQFGARKNRGLLFWLLVLVPLALPLFFIIEYSAWLWWYGHRLNDMGAFTVKPFMPTVFGDGKVAQFATHSYPHYGFGLMIVSSALLALAALLRRKELRAEE